MASLKKVLKAHRKEIASKWGHMLHSKGEPRYRASPLEELILLTAEAEAGNFEVLLNNDFTKLNSFIEKITEIRLESGFALSEVQKAFELYRTITLPILTREMSGIALSKALTKLNHCLSYTITRFSDYFQALHEKAVRDYAEELEVKVTERTHELSESESKYRMLVEDINDGYFINYNGTIVFANKTYCSMHGYTPKEIIGKSYLKFVAPESLEKVRSFYTKRLQSEKAPDQYIYFRLHKDGSALPTENKVKTISYSGSYAVAGICRDITERIKMEERLRESERLAHIGQLTTSLAHELRNPLSSIKMTNQMLLETEDLDEENRKALQISAKEITKLERVLSEMLDFARPVRLRKELVSINKIIESSIDILKVRIKEHRIAIKQKTMNHVPLQWLDPSKIEQAFINILLNSIEVMPQGGNISILTHMQNRDKPTVSVEISDSGPGVNAEDLPYIFNPFFTTKAGGTGLGLSNVKKIIEAHSGSVSACNKRKKFHIILNLPVEIKHE